MASYIQGESITLYANYLDSNSSPILAGISGAAIDIFYYGTSGTRQYQVQTGTMTQDPAALNVFYYQYDIPINAQVTNYVANYNVIFSGIYVNSTETFGVLVPGANSGIYVGSTQVSGTIVDTSGTGIANASVKVSLLNGANIITQTVANISGIYNLYLDPADYMMQASAAGYSSNSTAQTVPTGMTTFYWGNTTLIGGGTGSIVISDTASYYDSATMLDYPLVNVKVSLYARQGSTTLVSAIATTRTDSTGAFTMTAAAGEYVLRFEGNGANNTVYDTSYDIEVSDAFNSGLPLGFRYEGTSQYNFL